MSEIAIATIPTKPRVNSIDIVRGIIMVIMALDHIRDYFHKEALVFNPTDLEKTNVALFFTRWITHFCAPTFILLAGTSIYLMLQRKSKKELSKFLLTRGLWLIVLDFTLIRFVFFFNFYYDVTILTVFWVIGLSMICMAGIIWLSEKAILIVGLIILFLHNLIPISIPVVTAMGVLPLTPSSTIIIGYPLLQWLGIMMLGFALGSLYKDSVVPIQRQRMLIGLGITSVVLFILLRFINYYGDPSPWSAQKNMLFTVISYFNVSKYPPSLLFTLMTLGPVLILLAILDKAGEGRWKFFHVFGRVPLFYFVLHFFVAHAVALGVFMIQTGKSFSEINFHSLDNAFGGITPEGGNSLLWVYVAWVLIVLALYPLCKWYDHYKTTHKQWWLSYL